MVRRGVGGVAMMPFDRWAITPAQCKRHKWRRFRLRGQIRFRCARCGKVR